MAVRTDVIEGIVNDVVWFHYDLTDDVLYLRLTTHRETPTLGEETPDGYILLRREDDDMPVGLTIVSWWKRFGQGQLPDSLCQLASKIEPFTHRLAA